MGHGAVKVIMVIMGSFPVCFVYFVLKGVSFCLCQRKIKIERVREKERVYTQKEK